MAAGAACRRYIGPLLCVNLVMHAAVLGLAGWSVNKFIDGETHHHLGGNTSSGYLLVFSLMAGVVGVCSVLPGLLHARAWRGETLAAAASTGLVSWALTALSFGLTALCALAPAAYRLTHYYNPTTLGWRLIGNLTVFSLFLPFAASRASTSLGNRGRRLMTLEAFIAILTLTQLLYLILLHAGSLGSSMMLDLSRRNCDDDELRCDEIPREELYTNSKLARVAGARPSS